jgi:hypothetical protein
VTNWHNLSGKNALTGVHLNQKTLAEPNRVTFPVFIEKNLNMIGEARLDLDLLDDGAPVWLEHPMLGSKIDVAAIKLPSEIAPHFMAINEVATAPFSTRVGDDVFLLGVPSGIRTGPFPIWKRATIASEPEIGLDGLPKFFVDTASSKGMSGSAVVRYGSSGQTDDGNFTQFAGPVGRPIGIYSGRIPSAEASDPQLGIVWRIEVVDQIIGGQRRSLKQAKIEAVG